jgi:eukaryotic-like serine/threonine-protein kinase
VIPGSEIEGKYEILRKIREGGMGAVYEVRHRLLDERRVIKVIHPHLVSSPELVERFRREARAASGLRHPNIAHLHDFSVDAAGQASIVMELIDGLSLDEILRTTGPPPLGLGLEISRQALRAVGFLHRRGFLHRDISPDNLMLTRDPEGGPLVKLIDLGIAKVLVESGRGLTMAGTFLGKPRYASPEQLGAGDDPIDGRSDLYSLGIVIYELLTGVCPIAGDNPSSLLASHLFHAPLDFSVSDPGGRLPPDLRALLLQALAKKPGERFASAGEMAERLAAVQARFPWTPADLDAALARPDLDATMALPRKPPGSTQERLDRQFQQGETPGGTVPVPIVPVVPAALAPRTEVLPVAPAPLPFQATPPAPEPVPAPTPVSVPVPVVVPAREIPPEEPRKRRGAAGWIALAAAVLALAILVPVFLGQSGEESEAPEPAVAADASISGEAASPEPVASVPAPVILEEQVEPVPPVSTPIEPEPDPAPVPERQETIVERPTPAPPPASPPPAPRRSEEPRKTVTVTPDRPAPVPETPTEKPKQDRPSRRKVEQEEEISFIDPPVAVSMPVAPYPEAAFGSGAKARVLVSIQVNEKGEVTEARVASIAVEEGAETPAGVDLKALFREAALAAARRARFQPAMSDGRPVTYRGELTFSF